ncbi:MAG: hypothetical protein QW789_03560 [Nitrososphaerota archaeon]
MSESQPKIPIQFQKEASSTISAQMNNLFMSALLSACTSNCQCKACQRLRKIAEILEQQMDSDKL